MVERQSPVSLRRQCVPLGLSRAALYYRQAEVSACQLKLMALIDRQYLRAPLYRARHMAAAWLGIQGHTVNRKRVKRLMQLMGLAAIYQRPRTSRPAPEHRIYPICRAAQRSNGLIRYRPPASAISRWRAAFSTWSQ
jgi:putative transposase